MVTDAEGADRGPGGWDCHVHVFDAGAPVVEGHYQPAHRPLADIEALAQAHGIEHLVMVQPSVYGVDNTVMLEALRARPGRHRAVLVADESLLQADLAMLHAIGVRGVRFNLVSPVGNGARDFAVLAPSLRTMGWHAQWYAKPGDLPRIQRLHQGSGVVCVLDHLAGMHVELAPDDPAWEVLARIAADGAWIKLSGWYRLRAQLPYKALDASIGRVARLFGSRMVWGSDWPHTQFAADALPAYASQWEPVARVLPEALARQIHNEAPALLYG